MKTAIWRVLLAAWAALATACGGGGADGSSSSGGASGTSSFNVWTGNANEYLILDRTSEQFAARRADGQVLRLSDMVALTGLSVDTSSGALFASGTRIGNVALVSTPARAVFLCLDGSLLDIEFIGNSWNWNCPSSGPGGGGGGGGSGGTGASGEAANQCVLVRRVAGKNFAEMTNTCPYAIEVSWCYVSLDCKNGTWGLSSQSTLQSGQTKDAVTFGNNAAQYNLSYAACKGANVFFRETGPGVGECRP